MGPDAADSMVFECESCSARIYVDGAIREKLLVKGCCVECGSPISRDDFVPVTD
jgi:hypothetical protein